MNSKEIINELSKLYRLRNEGKKVESIIKEYEALLYQKCREEMDAEKEKQTDNER